MRQHDTLDQGILDYRRSLVEQGVPTLPDAPYERVVLLGTLLGQIAQRPYDHVMCDVARITHEFDQAVATLAPQPPQENALYQVRNIA